MQNIRQIAKKCNIKVFWNALVRILEKMVKFYYKNCEEISVKF